MSSPKRQRLDTDIHNAAHETYSPPQTRESAIALAQRLNRDFNLRIPVVINSGSESTGLSFSDVTYNYAAPRVGLDHAFKGDDIPFFELHRARIPTNIFKSIVEDIDILEIQYGTPFEQCNDEARSQCIAPVFNHLMAQFQFALKNKPETILRGRIGTHGRIEYIYNFFNTTMLLLVKVKYREVYAYERADIIGQVIAECDGCDTNNTSDEPVYCILIHGACFEFFKFQRRSASDSCTFSRGQFDGEYLTLPDKRYHPLQFITTLRMISEIVFDVILTAYISGVKILLKQFEEDTPSHKSWRRVLNLAESALGMFREAEGQRKQGDIRRAGVSAAQARIVLQGSVNAAPDAYISKSELLMSFWDEDVIGKT